MELENKLHSKPNFLIVGAARAGTTSAAKYLNEHPDIYIPERKELRFFAREVLKKVNPDDPSIETIYNSSIFNEDEYFAQFNSDTKLAGEASIHYLFHYKEVIPQIKKYLGDIPIIIFLRNPVTRAISNIKYMQSKHQSTIEQEINREEKRIEDGFNSFWYYLSLGLYSNQVDAYLNNFSSVKIILFENFIQNPQKELDKLYKFLSVPPYFLKDFAVHNKSLKLKKPFEFLKELSFINFFKKIIGYKGSQLIKKGLPSKIFEETELVAKPRTIKYLKNYYIEDIKKLENKLNLDLSLWRD